MRREAAKNFQELIVWQKAHQLVLDLYRLSEKFPHHELYGLTSQLRRAAIHSCQHSRGIQEKRKAGQGAVHEYCPWLS